MCLLSMLPSPIAAEPPSSLQFWDSNRESHLHCSPFALQLHHATMLTVLQAQVFCAVKPDDYCWAAEKYQGHCMTSVTSTRYQSELLDTPVGCHMSHHLTCHCYRTYNQTLIMLNSIMHCASIMHYAH